jgi:hypothetical protein
VLLDADAVASLELHACRLALQDDDAPRVGRQRLKGSRPVRTRALAREKGSGDVHLEGLVGSLAVAGGPEQGELTAGERHGDLHVAAA